MRRGGSALLRYRLLLEFRVKSPARATDCGATAGLPYLSVLWPPLSLKDWRRGPQTGSGRHPPRCGSGAAGRACGTRQQLGRSAGGGPLPRESASGRRAKARSHAPPYPALPWLPHHVSCRAVTPARCQEAEAHAPLPRYAAVTSAAPRRSQGEQPALARSPGSRARPPASGYNTAATHIHLHRQLRLILNEREEEARVALASGRKWPRGYTTASFPAPAWLAARATSAEARRGEARPDRCRQPRSQRRKRRRGDVCRKAEARLPLRPPLPLPEDATARRSRNVEARSARPDNGPLQLRIKLSI
ncbi:skin secretory protein xP2-like [Schistocerca piceifrons]|uniref:skin secretory protein xP2-like n=1 Tax=Schistocerca piceifrons TaxID=274613 RepID=UPI001F5ED6A8|nr:skin secretory protein xP2-like [Schistocerca piceifrons]